MFKWILLAVIVVPTFVFGDDSPKAQTYKVRGDIAAADLTAIEALTAELTKQPILEISAAKAGSVTVTTGIVRGPLDGRGNIYMFVHKDGKWTLSKRSSWVS